MKVYSWENRRSDTCGISSKLCLIAPMVIGNMDATVAQNLHSPMNSKFLFVLRNGHDPATAEKKLCIHLLMMISGVCFQYSQHPIPHGRFHLSSETKILHEFVKTFAERRLFGLMWVGFRNEKWILLYVPELLADDWNTILCPTIFVRMRWVTCILYGVSCVNMGCHHPETPSTSSIAEYCYWGSNVCSVYFRILHPLSNSSDHLTPV